MGRGLSQGTRLLIEMAHHVLEAENPMTLRQLFYRLVSVRVLDNRQADYLRLSRVLTGARERGEVPFEWMVDRSRPAYQVNAFEDPAQYAEAVRRSYRKNYWSDQPWHVEIWAEKDAILGSIQPVTDKYGVMVRVGRGFLSTTRAHEIGGFFSSLEKPISIFYLGDHDPSGICIERDARTRVARWMHGGHLFPALVPIESAFTMERLAIHAEDIQGFDLPPLRIKAADPRSGEFQRRHGTECVELDALPPGQLRSRLDGAISSLIDHTAWDRAIVVERAELASIKKIAGKIARLKSGGAETAPKGTST